MASKLQRSGLAESWDQLAFDIRELSGKANHFRWFPEDIETFKQGSVLPLAIETLHAGYFTDNYNDAEHFIRERFQGPPTLGEIPDNKIWDGCKQTCRVWGKTFEEIANLVRGDSTAEPSESWITFTAAKKQIQHEVRRFYDDCTDAKATGMLNRAATKGIIRTNGQKYREKRYAQQSLDAYLKRLRDREEEQEFAKEDE